MTTLHLRPAKPTDLPDCHSIFTYWCLNSVATGYDAANPPPLSTITSSYAQTQQYKCPFVVALVRAENSDAQGEIAGYMYALPLYTSPCNRTVMLSTYVSPSYRRSPLQIGSALTRRMLSLLTDPNTAPKAEGWEPGELRKWDTVLRGMTKETGGLGEGKERFFTKFGFTEVGLLERQMFKDEEWWAMWFWALDLRKWDAERGKLKESEIAAKL